MKGMPGMYPEHADRYPEQTRLCGVVEGYLANVLT